MDKKTADAYPPAYQPATGFPAAQQHAGWSSGLCDCFSDMKLCCMTCWCPCVTVGQIAEIVDRGATTCSTAGGLYFLLNWLTGCGCLYSCTYRSKLRSQYMLTEEPCNDCLVHCCCEGCALCQEYRELQYRGFDPFIGKCGKAKSHGEHGNSSPC